MVSYKFKREVSSNLFPVGFSRAVLTKVAEIDNNTTGKSWIQLTFRNGAKIHNEKLYMTAAAEDRLRKIIVRLGLVGKDEAEKEVTLDDAVGKEFVIEIKHETYEGEERSKMAYVGLWTLDHEDKKVKRGFAPKTGRSRRGRLRKQPKRKPANLTPWTTSDAAPGGGAGCSSVAGSARPI